MKIKREEILGLRSEGKSYGQIAKILNINKSAVAYYCRTVEQNRARNKKSLATRERGRPLYIKRRAFGTSKKCKKESITLRILKQKNLQFRREITMAGRQYTPPTFTIQELKDKIGTNPECYLTGRKVDLTKSKEFELDHIIPRSKGGTNDLDNCGLSCREANRAKGDMILEEFTLLCKQVLEKQGFKVIKDEPTEDASKP